MQLSTRLWLAGALLPALVMGAVLFGADLWFRYGLLRSLDRALLAQAAVESVSLFDGPGQRPHLHMASSPLVESVRAFAPEGVLFGPDGHEVMRYPPVARPAKHETIRLGTPGAPPVLTTREHGTTRERTLTVTVSSPAGQPYLLRLTAAMAQVDAAQATFHRLSLAALSLVALSLVLLQTWQGRTLKRRLGELSSHVQALRAGDLTRTLAPERSDDELAALRAVLTQATLALKQGRDGKERLLADAAHELRTPLTLMRTGLDLALRRERSVDELKRALSETRDEVDRLAALATRLLDSAALAHQSEPAEPCDLGQLLRTALDQARPEAEARDLTVSLTLPQQTIAQLRPHAVRQAVDNLLSNALKYAHSSIALHLTRQGPLLRLAVCDDGPGIAPSERELVFEPFHRLRHAGPGAGLGLAIVREVARAHGGKAYVAESTQGAELVLELHEQPAAGPGDAPSV